MTTENTKTGFMKIMGLALAAGIVSIVINTILFFIGHSSGLFPETVLLPNQTEPLTLMPVIFASILPSMIAGLVFGIIYKYAKNGKKLFTIFSVILLVLSFANPFFIPGAPIGMILMLNIMHVVVAADVLYIFNKYTA